MAELEEICSKISGGNISTYSFKDMTVHFSDL